MPKRYKIICTVPLFLVLLVLKSLIVWKIGWSSYLWFGHNYVIKMQIQNLKIFFWTLNNVFL